MYFWAKSEGYPRKRETMAVTTMQISVLPWITAALVVELIHGVGGYMVTSFKTWSKSEMWGVIRFVYAKGSLKKKQKNFLMKLFHIVVRMPWRKDRWRRQGDQVLILFRELAVPNLLPPTKMCAHIRFGSADSLLIIKTFDWCILSIFHFYLIFCLWYHAINEVGFLIDCSRVAFSLQKSDHLYLILTSFDWW